jgi:hypothetical protein
MQGGGREELTKEGREGKSMKERKERGKNERMK